MKTQEVLSVCFLGSCIVYDNFQKRRQEDYLFKKTVKTEKIIQGYLKTKKIFEKYKRKRKMRRQKFLMIE